MKPTKMDIALAFAASTIVFLAILIINSTLKSL